MTLDRWQDKIARHQQAGQRVPPTHDASWRPIRGHADGTKAFRSWRVANQPFGKTPSQRDGRRFSQQDGSNRMGHPQQRHTLQRSGLRGGLNRGMEKTPKVRAWRSLRDSALFHPFGDDE